MRRTGACGATARASLLAWPSPACARPSRRSATRTQRRSRCLTWAAATAAARKARRPGLDVEYVAGDAASLAAAAQAGRFDVAFAGNVYQLLSPGGRRDFAAALAALVRPGGLLFLSTLSPRDPQHYAVGERVLGEERSWVEHVYLHFCTADELTADFSAFTVLDVEERSYEEHTAGGVVHRHASWFLEGRRR